MVGIRTISAVKLEQISKVLKLLVTDIQHGGAGTSNSNPAKASTTSLSVKPGVNTEFDACEGRGLAR